MNLKPLVLTLAALSSPLFAQHDADLKRQIQQLQRQTTALQHQLNHLQKQLITKKSSKKAATPSHKSNKTLSESFHSSHLTVHAVDGDHSSPSFYPTALIADGQVVTYIGGTPVVSSPYLGDRPAFDGSDYIVNISSIDRDIRLMQQRHRFYQAYAHMGYSVPPMPIISISGKTEPIAYWNKPFIGASTGDLSLGSSELDIAASVNEWVQGFISLAYDDSPPAISGPRVANSAFRLNLGFVNIGNLENTPFYFTAGQLYAPFGRYASAMVSSPLTLSLARTKTRPFIFGYKSQGASGPAASVYVFKSETLEGHSGVGGVNVGYIVKSSNISGELGVSYIGSIADSAGFQNTGSTPNTTFGGFSSITNGTEWVKKIPGVDLHANFSFDRYNLTAEWVTAAQPFRVEDLSMNGLAAKPNAGQLEAAFTFNLLNKPASLGAGYQWTKDALALNLPKQRISTVFNISLWKDTVESLEYRHDFDYGSTQYANGAFAANNVNLNTLGTGRSSDMIVAQVGVFF